LLKVERQVIKNLVLSPTTRRKRIRIW